MEKNLRAFVKQISKEKELDIEIVKEAIEQAIVSASRKTLSSFVNARPVLDVETGDLDIYVTKTVAETVENPRTQVTQSEARHIKKGLAIGDEIEVKIDASEFGRIAAQSVRQGIMQRLRDAERDKVYSEYVDKVGQLVTSIVQRYERRDVIVNLGRGEAILPAEEIPTGVKYHHGDRLKLLIIEVRKVQKGPPVRVSRTRPELVIRLFEQEVPEVSDGTVKIVGVAREAGVRTKIAVSSTNPDVDPVGACVGMKGSRVQMIVRELENEKIDIVPYSDDSATFIGNALNPAEIHRINLDKETKQAHVIVGQQSLSIAIGKKGQNAKLAARLTGWKIDIKSEEAAEAAQAEAEARKKYMLDFLGQIEGLTEEQRQQIMMSRFDTVEKISQADPAGLLEFTGDSAALAEDLVDGAKQYVDALRELTERMKEDAEPSDQTESANAAPEEEQGQPEEAPSSESEEGGEVKS
jgi:N utilization substance protein A